MHGAARGRSPGLRRLAVAVTVAVVRLRWAIRGSSQRGARS